MEDNNNQNNNQQPITQPADNGDQGGGKLFTQEEVNNIIRDRLARERAKNTPQEPTEEEKRLKDLNDRESKLVCREYVMDQGLPSQLLDVLDTSNHEEFKNKADIVSGLLKTSNSTGKANDPALAEMKLRIAQQEGIPIELAARLTGTNEKEILQDAATMRGIIRAIKGPPPLHDPESCNRGTAVGTGFKKTKHTPRPFGGSYDT